MPVFGNRNKPNMKGEGTMSGRQARKDVSGGSAGRGKPPQCAHFGCRADARVYDKHTKKNWCHDHQPDD